MEIEGEVYTSCVHYILQILLAWQKELEFLSGELNFAPSLGNIPINFIEINTLLNITFPDQWKIDYLLLQRM